MKWLLLKLRYRFGSLAQETDILPQDSHITTRDGFHKSWVQGVKRKVHPILGENAISWA